MNLFLLRYDRHAGKLISIETFPDSERDRVMQERRRLETSWPSHLEVMVLEADSEATIRRTHRRYFQTIEEMLADPEPSR